MFDIITFGSVTWDIFLTPEKFKILRDKKFSTRKALCFDFASKIEAKDIYFASGGGGSNSATTLSKQGFKVAYCGRVGRDRAGQEIIEKIEKMGVNCQFVLKTKKAPTNHSVILNIPKKDRTIIVYRGASGFLAKEDLPWAKLKAKWFYLAPFSGELAKMSKVLVDFAKENVIKVLFNPSQTQLSMKKLVLKNIISKVDILLLNQEEASKLTKVPYEKEEKVFKKLDRICPGIAIMTKGKKGVTVSDGNYLYKSGSIRTKVVDKTGAGDAFGSGFLSGILKSEGSIEYAIQLGTANARRCLKEKGAKQGLLGRGENFEKVKVKKKKL